MVISLAANGFLFSPYIVFIGTIHCHLQFNEGKYKCMNLNWDLTFNENHWSTLETTK